MNDPDLCLEVVSRSYDMIRYDRRVYRGLEFSLI